MPLPPDQRVILALDDALNACAALSNAPDLRQHLPRRFLDQLMH
jgi:hypothetical protein